MNPVVHFEMPYQDADRVMEFYRTVFGWQLQLLGQEMGGYVLATTAVEDTNSGSPKGAINGGFFPTVHGAPPQYPSLTIGTADIQETVQKITRAGGRVLGEPALVPGIGLYVSFVDTEGNRNSVLQPMGDGPDSLR